MVVLDLLAALDGSLPECLRPGTPMEAVEAALGPPSDRSRFRRGTGIWRYGAIELHFVGDARGSKLWMVFSDAPQLVGDGGLEVAPGWLVPGLDEAMVRARLPGARRVDRGSTGVVLQHGPYAELGFDLVDERLVLVSLTFRARE